VFNLAPFAEETVTHITSNSPNPNFQGNWLPTSRSVSGSGFDATWRISYLGRNYPQSWISGADMRKAIDTSRFGIELNNPVDHYRMADRSVKYAGLYILLTFAAIWLIEVLSTVRVHPIQYLMLGAALCVFYLLELSLSEHIAFPLAYATACTSVIGMTAVYSRVIFPNDRRDGIVAACVTGLYGYLFVVLTNEDNALLIGSIGLFVILAAIMYLTRRVDWYANERRTTATT
jgi:inner membrane protein